MRENAEKARENFRENLINIAHQIKTPLTAALLTLQIMEKKEPGRYTEAIGRQLRRLNRLEEELMLLSTIDSGTLTGGRESCGICRGPGHTDPGAGPGKGRVYRRHGMDHGSRNEPSEKFHGTFAGGKPDRM